MVGRGSRHRADGRRVYELLRDGKFVLVRRAVELDRPDIVHASTRIPTADAVLVSRQLRRVGERTAT